MAPKLMWEQRKVETLYLYSNRAAEGENLPPTYGALDLRIRRIHYIAMIWRKANENHPPLPKPTAFGWTFDAGSSHLSPVRRLNPPAPEAMLHLIKRKFKRGCEGNFSFRKNNIPCTEVCGSWVFTCNNKTNQLGTNEECEDDWPIHRVTFSFVRSENNCIPSFHVINTLL